MAEKSSSSPRSVVVVECSAPAADIPQRSTEEPDQAPTAREIRTRESCDACLKVKMKCNKQKPTCDRCTRLKYSCIYSPSKRTGRPKTGQRRRPKRSSTRMTENRESMMSEWESGDGLAPVSTDISMSDRPNALPPLAIGFPQLSPSPEVQIPNVPTREQSSFRPSPLASLLAENSISRQPSAIGSVAVYPNPPRVFNASNCYVSILCRLTELEKTIEGVPQPIRLDVILEAELDAQALTRRLFSCRGHEATPNESCLDVHASSLMLLMLLTTRIIGMLEGLFHHAASVTDRLGRELGASWPMAASPGSTASRTSEKRLERSWRSSLIRNISCPVPEADCVLAIGDYEVDHEAKSRAMKQILRRRVRGLDHTLEDIKAYLAGSHQDQSRRSSVVDSSGGILTAAANMAGDLRRRVELLQGRVELIE